MSSGSNNSGGDPDFSFLGDQSLPGGADGGHGADVPDFADAPPDVPDFSGFGKVEDTPDFSTDSFSPPDVSSPTIEPSAEPVQKTPPPEPAVAPVAPVVVERVRATKRLQPKAARPAETPTPTAPVNAPPAARRQPSRTAAPSPPSQPLPVDAALESGDSEADELPPKQPSSTSDKAFPLLAGYAAAVTLAFLGLLLTGRISLSGRNILESLPDVEPLRQNEFRLVPPDAELPGGHTLNLGDSQRFGDVVLTPLKVTREQLTFVNMMNGTVAEGKVSKPVLKLWFRMTNASPNIAFPPWDVALMTHRSEKDESAIANSWLMVKESAADTETQILNFYHSPDSHLDLSDQHSRELINPGQQLTSFIASSEAISMITPEKIENYRWRIQIRKGVHVESGHGVTTLVDVNFSPDDIES